MIVSKFGGTSLRDADAIRQAANIVVQNKHAMVVVSAVSGMTDALLAHDVARIQKTHKKILNDLELPNDLLDKELEELVTIKPTDARTRDHAMSFGERMSAKILAAHLTKQGTPAQAYPAYDLGLRTDDTFGNAHPIQQFDVSALNESCISVVTGFIAKNKAGVITTLGRSGSDFTAALLGVAAKAEEIHIWTDVDGVKTADPKIVPDARALPEITFAEMNELAYFGAEVVHPKTLLPAMRANIPVIVKNTHNPTAQGTRIVADMEHHQTVKAITCKKNITLLNAESSRMLFAHGFLARLFSVFEKHRVSVDMICTSEVSVTMSIDDVQKADGVPLQQIQQELSEIAQTHIIQDKAIVCVVGEGIKYDTSLLSRIFSVVNKQNIFVEMVSLGASRMNVSFVVDQKQAETVVQTLHDELISTLTL